MTDDRRAGRTNLRPLKVTAVGDGLVGKTCMLITYTTQRFPEEYIPTVFDNFADKLHVDGVEYNLTLWDTAGQEDYERLRPLSYTNTDCFLLCFAINNKNSFNNIVNKWCPELKNYCPNVPVILVATKSDLRNEDNDSLISVKDGKKMKRKIGAIKYMECSALKQEGLKEIIAEAVRSSLKKKKTSAKPLSRLCCCFRCQGS